MPDEIYQLEHWGMPWSRREDGKIGQRAFGGYSFPRASYASDKVGFFEMQTLYDTCQKFDNIEFLNEWFALDLVVNQGQEVVGATLMSIETSEVVCVRAKATVIAFPIPLDPPVTIAFFPVKESFILTLHPYQY